MKVACRYHKTDLFDEIFNEYQELCRKDAGVLQAVLICVTPPGDEQLEGIRNFSVQRISGTEGRDSDN